MEDKKTTQCDTENTKTPENNRANRNGRNRKPNNGKPGRERKGGNNPAWYASDSTLLRDSASIPFSWATGTPIDLHNPNLAGISDRGKFTVPGICAVGLTPSVGYSNDRISPINIASTATYSFIRHANSGHANYDSPDLMLYIMAMTSVYSYINFLQRCYGITTLYSQRNRYMPKSLLKVSGCDAGDLMAHQADFRYGVNVLINKAASLAVPNNMTIFNRHAFLYSNLYAEGTSIKDQMYMYVPDGFYFFKLDEDGAGMLDIKPFDRTKAHTVQELLDYGNMLLNPLVADEDINIMSGDILKAYGQNIIKLTSLDTFYPLAPVFDIGVLEQIKNATIVSGVKGLEVKQSPNKADLYSTPYVESVVESVTYLSNVEAYRLRTYTEDRVLTTTTAEVTPELVIESTRLMVTGFNWEKSTDGKTTKVLLHPGSEVATSLNLVRFAVNASGELEDVISTADYAAMWDTTMGVDTTVKELRAFTNLSHFKFHPAVHLLGVKAGTATNSVSVADGFFNFDVDNYAILNDDDISRMHETALLNMLHVPSIAKV